MNQKVLLLVGVAALAYMGLFRITGSEVRSETEIDITRGTVEPSPIAVTNFHANDPSALVLGAEISTVIAANLESSGLFRPIDQGAFQQKPEELQQIPRFVDWRQINAEFLVSGMVEVGPDNLVSVEFRLWNVVSEQYMVGKRLKTPKANWRRVAHLISDELYTRVTGEGGYFDTRIVYVAESGPPDNRVKQLALMDQDGENHRYLTDGRHMALTPRFSPTLQEITYLSYFNDKPRVYIYTIDTGKQEVLGDFPGMTFAPRFSPDGNQVIMSMVDTRIITQTGGYWHVEFTTRWIRFIDDVEFYFPESEALIHLRSASRSGFWDLGVNRKRTNEIRSRFEELAKGN